MKNLVSIAAVVLCSVAAACGAPPNPLIGKWKLTTPTGAPNRFYAGCPTSMVFTATSQTMTAGGKSGTENITYIYSDTATYPTAVYVGGNSTKHTKYQFPSKDRVVLDTVAGCTYQRE